MNVTIFEKKGIENKGLVLILSTIFVWKILSLKRTERDIQNYICLHVKYPLFLSDFNEIWIFWKDFRKIIKYQISWKSVQREPSCSTQTDGRAGGHDEANSRFS